MLNQLRRHPLPGKFTFLILIFCRISSVGDMFCISQWEVFKKTGPIEINKAKEKKTMESWGKFLIRDLFVSISSIKLAFLRILQLCLNPIRKANVFYSMPILFILKWRASLFFFCKSQFALIEHRANNNGRVFPWRVIFLTWILNAFLILLEFMKNLTKQITVTLCLCIGEHVANIRTHSISSGGYYETWGYWSVHNNNFFNGRTRTPGFVPTTTPYSACGLNVTECTCHSESA